MDPEKDNESSDPLMDRDHHSRRSLIIGAGLAGVGYAGERLVKPEPTLIRGPSTVPPSPSRQPTSAPGR